MRLGRVLYQVFWAWLFIGPFIVQSAARLSWSVHYQNNETKKSIVSGLLGLNVQCCIPVLVATSRHPYSLLEVMYNPKPHRQYLEFPWKCSLQMLPCVQGCTWTHTVVLTWHFLWWECFMSVLLSAWGSIEVTEVWDYLFSRRLWKINNMQKE